MQSEAGDTWQRSARLPKSHTFQINRSHYLPDRHLWPRSLPIWQTPATLSKVLKKHSWQTSGSLAAVRPPAQAQCKAVATAHAVSTSPCREHGLVRAQESQGLGKGSPGCHPCIAVLWADSAAGVGAPKARLARAGPAQHPGCSGVRRRVWNLTLGSTWS